MASTDDDSSTDAPNPWTGLPNASRPVVADRPIPALRTVTVDPERRGSHEVELALVEVPAVHYVCFGYLGGGTHRRSLKLAVIPGRDNPDHVACEFHPSRDGLVELHRQLGAWLAMTDGERDTGWPPEEAPAATARARISPGVIEACARAGWYAQVAFDDEGSGGVPGGAHGSEGWSWAYVQNAKREALRDSAAGVLNGTKQHFGTPRVRLFHDVVWATATVLLGTCPGTITGVHAPGCAAPRTPPSPAARMCTAAQTVDRAEHVEAVDYLNARLMETVHDLLGARREVESLRLQLDLADRATTPEQQGQPFMSTTPKSSDLQNTVFHILIVDGKRCSEYRVICTPGRQRCEFRAENELAEAQWISVDIGDKRNLLGLSNDFVVSMMLRLIATGRAQVIPNRTQVKKPFLDVDLGMIDLAPELSDSAEA